MEDCIFCKIAAHQIPSQVVYEDDQIMAFNDINPVAPVHILIIPKEHCSSLLEAGGEATLVLGKIQQVAAQIAREKGLGSTGFRLLTNCGPNAGQVVMHLHYHLLGGDQLAPIGWSK